VGNTAIGRAALWPGSHAYLFRAGHGASPAEYGPLLPKYIPGKLPFPSIMVRVELGSREAFSVELIDGKLASVPPHIQQVLSEGGMLLLTLAMVLHYIDLFVVTAQQTTRPVSSRQVSDDHSTTPSWSRHESLPVRVRMIPRRERTGVAAQSSSTHERLQTAQVDPFRRRLPQG
jgi:hypothetical protein